MAKEISYVKLIDFDEAQTNDTGMLPGDHLGAAGLPSRLFAHTFRNWSWALHTKIQAKPPRIGRTAQVTIPNKNIRQGVITRKINTHSKRRLQASASIKHVSSKIRKRPIRDAIDRDALKNMRTLRVSWCKAEDDVLKMARTVYLYMGAPAAILGSLQVGKICRDVMRFSIGSNNKTSQACVRRINFLMKMHRHAPEVPTWLHMLQTNQEMNRRYGDKFLVKLKKIYPIRTEYEQAVIIHFILIGSLLYEIIHESIRDSSNQFSIPDHQSEFNNKFRQRQPETQAGTLEYFNPTTEYNIQVMLVISVLHSSLCCARDKTLYNAQAFEIYKNFTEEILQAAFQKVRRESLVVPIKRKQYQMLPTLLSGPAYILSSKYRLRLLFLKIPYITYDTFYAYFQTALCKFYSQCKSESEPPTLELKSPNSGHFIFIAEGTAANFLSIDVKLPKNILTVDADQRQACSASDRILSHYHVIFENAPETEYTKNIENEPHKKQKLRVKFHPANLRYKVNYVPFDVISKLPPRYLHFFCALNHLQEEVDINFSKLCRQDDDDSGRFVIECPFRCIMKSSNYIDAIERIVREKKSMLDELSEMAPQKLLNLANSGCSVMVQSTNLLTLVRMLESFWCEKELPFERKDLGKLRANLKQKKSIDWRQLCKDILEFNPSEETHDKNDEYEPTLNKEEPFVRAQDVLVVNLPTMQFRDSGAHSKDNKTINRNDLCIPKSLLESEEQREVVLQKLLNESLWKYTDNTFETLKPQLNDLKFNKVERQHLEDIHNVIETQSFGVTATDLMRKYPCKNFLLRALHTLSEHHLIKRVGVASFVYVHKSHIRAWLVHTFHIKRLERENQNSAAYSQKRKQSDRKDEETGAAAENAEIGSPNKKMKRTRSTENLESVQIPSKRVSKPVKRFDDIDEQSVSTKPVDSREIIVMKPFPWVRLNGSLNRRVLDRYLGSILIECIARSGWNVLEVCARFSYLYPVDVMLLLEALNELKCICLTEEQANEVHLMSKYENLRETIVTELYDPKFTYVTVEADAVMRLTTFFGDKKYKVEFV